MTPTHSFSFGVATLIALLALPALQGCKQEAPPSPPRDLHVPDTAKLVISAGPQSEVLFKAPADGRVWVFDETDNRVVGRKRVREGQKFTLQPVKDEAALDGKRITEIERGQLSGQHSYRIYFEKE